MIQLVWLTISFQIFMALTLSYNLFIPIHKSCSYRSISLQEFKQNDLRTCCSSSKSRKKKKRRVYVKPWLKRRKNLELYGTVLAELQLEEEYNYNIVLQMTSENFVEIFQLIKDDIPNENTNLKELILPRLNLQLQLAFYQQGSIVANSSGFAGRLPGFCIFSRIPHGFGIVLGFSRIYKRWPRKHMDFSRILKR